MMNISNDRVVKNSNSLHSLQLKFENPSPTIINQFYSYQKWIQLNTNTQKPIEEFDFNSDFTNNGGNNLNNFNSKNQLNPLTLRQKAAMSMSMVDENSNTIPFFQKRHSTKSSYGGQNDQLFQNKPCYTSRQPFEEVLAIQPQQIYYSSKSISCEEQQNPIQNAKYSSQNVRIQQQGNYLNHYSNDLSPIEMTQQQLSTQSSSPDFDLAIAKNPQSSSSHANISTKTGSFVGSGLNNGMTSSYQNSNFSNNGLQRNSSQQQQPMLASKSFKNYSQCGNSMQELSSISTRNTSLSTNGSTGLSKNKSHNYTLQDEYDENSNTRDNHYIEQMECQEVEDFSLYVQEYEKNKAESMEQQQQTVSQEDIYQEQLFGSNPQYVPKYGYQIVQNLFKSQKNYKITVITDPRELMLRENLIDLMTRLHSHLKLQDETLYLSVNIFARYLDLGERQNFQDTKIIILVVTCLFVAAKYQEIYPPPLRDFQAVLKLHKICASTSEILDQEGNILNKLNFSLFGPTRLQFLEAYLSQISLDPSQISFCFYLLELTNLNHSFFRYDHSEIAAAAILLSEKFKNISGKYFWNEKLEIITNYKQQDVYDCVEELYQYLVNVGHNRRQLFIYSKYSDPKYKSVAQIDYDLTNNLNNQSAQQNNQEFPPICTSNISNSQENKISQQRQQKQQNYMNKSMTQSQQLNQSIHQNSNNYNSNTMTQSTYISYSQSSQNCDSQQQQQQQQYFSQQMTQNYPAPCSKAKSECYVEDFNENSMNYMSEVRAGQSSRQYDITRYLKNCKPSYKQ